MTGLKVTLFCASSSSVDHSYKMAAREVGLFLARNNHHLIFGGGSKGLMGAVADAVITSGGKISGVMPAFMKSLEWAHPKVVDMTFTETMAERKELLVKDCDLVLVLPGSVGTLEEVFEVLSLKRLGLFFKPVIFYNVNGYFNDLLSHLNKMVAENFMRDIHGEMWQEAVSIDALKELIDTPVSWPADAQKFASS